MDSTTAPSVLIVEDERIVAKDLEDTLAELGYSTSAIASSADEAVAEASKRCPDVVLMDIRIKGEQDGVETAELLRRRFDVPVVYMTAHADEATLQRAKKTEPYAYLVKPVKSNALRSAIEIALYRHRLERRLRERERWFSTIVRSIADAIVAVDLAGNITLLNPAAELLLGKKLEDVAGLPAREVLQWLPARGGDGDDPPLYRALRERKQVHLAEGTLIGPDSTPRIVSDSAAPVLDEEHLLGAVMVFRDVTEQKRLQNQLELSDRLASLGTMAAGVAHEINNPLAVVMANASLLLEERGVSPVPRDAAHAGDGAVAVPRGDQELEALTEISTAAGRIANIVRDLMTFARPTQRTAGNADVRRAVAWAVRTTSHEFRHRAPVRADVGDVPPVAIDEVRLGQVLVNLLVNAAQAIAPGDVANNEVSIRARAEGEDRVVIEVRDSGAGMPKEIAKRVFEPFFTTKPVGVGTGVGLSISRGMVRSAGGDIDVESAVGRGTTFRIALPRATFEKPVAAAAAAPAAAPRRGRILVVDDEDIVLRTLQRILADHDVVCANSVRAATRLIERGERFDLVLSDVMMPDATGIALYEWLLARDPDLAARVLFMTGGAVTPTVDAFLGSIENPHIEKPFSVEQLRSEVRKFLERLQKP
ncbi:MAG TPA: response regulator [Polyangiaceae bacterium]|nr:response regulator [Polyangiaceae bacterium]